jgi:hypothetical protein
MAETLSTMLPLGTRIPAFALPDAVSGRRCNIKWRDAAAKRG